MTPSAPPTDRPALCVLASGSSGNCSVLSVPATESTSRRVFLIDAGLSPKRTTNLLLERDIRPDEVDGIILTHLDQDHCHTGWPNAIRPGGWRTPLYLHQRHVGRAERSGLAAAPIEVFDDRLALPGGVDASALLMSHDSLGVAVFRFRVRVGTRALDVGFATDLGRVNSKLTRFLSGVDLLAIESNYCPAMQRDSGRPAFVQDRITGGSGHLSNKESAAAVRAIAPSRAVVLLHLSRQCNTPELARSAHEGFDPVVTSQYEATDWITAGVGTRRCSDPAPVEQTMLFGADQGDEL